MRATRSRTRHVGVAITQQLVLLGADGGHYVLHGSHPRYGGVLQHGQIVLHGELGADFAPLVQKTALREEEDPRPLAGQVRLSEVARQLAQ